MAEKGSLGALEQSKRIHKEAPSDILSERFTGVLSAINIGGVKASTLFLIPDEVEGYITSGNLGKSFKRLYSGTAISHFHGEMADRYAHHSFVKPGYVAEELVINEHGVESVVGFARTPEGTKYGLPVAALAMKFELDNNISLASIFGGLSSTSEKAKAPYMRARILQYLYDQYVINNRQTIITEKELVEEFNTHGSIIYSNLLPLHRSGVVDYKSLTLRTGVTASFKVRTDMSRDALPSLEAKRRNGVVRAHLRKAVVDIIDTLCQSNTAITVDDVFTHIDSTVGDMYNSPHALKMTIAEIFKELRRMGYITHGDYQIRQVLSQVHMTNLGRKVVKELLIPLTEIINDNQQTLRQYTALANEYGVLEKMMEIAPRLADIYYPFSASRRIVSSISKQYELIDILQGAPQRGYPISYLAKRLGLDRETIRRHLKRMPQFIIQNLPHLHLVSLPHNEATFFYRIDK